MRQRKHGVANIYQLFASPKVAVHETYPPSSWLFRKHADTRPVGNNSIYVWSNEKRKVLNLIWGRRASLPLLMENSRGMQQFRRSCEMKRSPKPAFDRSRLTLVFCSRPADGNAPNTHFLFQEFSVCFKFTSHLIQLDPWLGLFLCSHRKSQQNPHSYWHERCWHWTPSGLSQIFFFGLRLQPNFSIR